MIFVHIGDIPCTKKRDLIYKILVSKNRYLIGPHLLKNRKWTKVGFRRHACSEINISNRVRSFLQLILRVSFLLLLGQRFLFIIINLHRNFSRFLFPGGGGNFHGQPAALWVLASLRLRLNGDD